MHSNRMYATRGSLSKGNEKYLDLVFLGIEKNNMLFSENPRLSSFFMQSDAAVDGSTVHSNSRYLRKCVYATLIRWEYVEHEVQAFGPYVALLTFSCGIWAWEQWTSQYACGSDVPKNDSTSKVQAQDAHIQQDAQQALYRHANEA